MALEQWPSFRKAKIDGRSLILLQSNDCVSVTCVDSLVDFQVFRSGKDLATTRKRTRERLLSRVDSDVINQFVLGLEWPPVPGTVFPVAGVVCYLRSTDMLHCDMSNDFVKGSENLVARLLW